MSSDVQYQLRELQRKHAEAVNQLQSNEVELSILREAAEATAELQSQDMQGAKVIDLAKKNRALNLALEREKQKVVKLQSDLAVGGGGCGGNGEGGTTASGLAPEAVEDMARGLVQQAAEAVAVAQKETSVWKERTQQQTNKMSQLEQKAFGLEIENKKLQRALIREVGEEVPLAKVLEDGSDWKGRREQIIALRDQVKQLKTAQGQVGESKQDAQARKAIGKVVNSRSQEADRVSADLAAARQELESLKLKHDGSVSRRRVLENELTSTRDKMTFVLEKTQNDDRLIAALKNEVSSLKKQGAAPGPAVPPLSSRPASGGAGRNAVEDEIWQELSMLRRRCSEQEKQVDTQEQIILALQQQMQTATPAAGGAGA